MGESSPQADAIAAFSLLSHLYLTPVLIALIRGGVPDHLDQGPLPAKDLAKRAGLDELSLTRALRALGAFGAFQEVSPGIFANNSVSDFSRDRPGNFRNAALFWGSEHLLQSAAALGHSIKTGEATFVHVFGESFWDRMRRLPKENELFNHALADLRGDEHRQIADAYDWSGVRTVVDVGGGAGSLPASERQLFQSNFGRGRSLGSLPGSSRLARRRLPHYPQELPRGNARYGPAARHGNAYRALQA